MAAFAAFIPPAFLGHATLEQNACLLQDGPGFTPRYGAPKLWVLDTEVVDCPVTAFFKISVSHPSKPGDSHHIMKCIDDISRLHEAVAFELRRTSLPTLPVARSMAELAGIEFRVILTAYFHQLTLDPDITSAECFLQFFQLSDVYQRRWQSAPSKERLSPQGVPLTQQSVDSSRIGGMCTKAVQSPRANRCLEEPAANRNIGSYLASEFWDLQSAPSKERHPPPAVSPALEHAKSAGIPGMFTQAVQSPRADRLWEEPIVNQAMGSYPAARSLDPEEKSSANGFLSHRAPTSAQSHRSVSAAVSLASQACDDVDRVIFRSRDARAVAYAAMQKASPRTPVSAPIAQSGFTAAKATASEGQADQEEPSQCVICMERPQEVAIVPCGHYSMCSCCAASMQQCPVCRGPVERTLKIFSA